MNFAQKTLQSLKYIKVQDLIAPLQFIFIYPFGMIYRIYLRLAKKELWLVSEGRNDARDNGYVLFKYIREQHPDLNVYYAVDVRSKAYVKIGFLGNIVNFGSLKHWLYYIAASQNISIHKAANPNPPLFYVLHRLKIINGHRMFLQHGVIMNDLKYLYASETNFEFFLSGAYPEFKFIKEKFGYPKGVVQYLGLPRFDRLHQAAVDKQSLVIMPTWRSWLGREENRFGQNISFVDSEYYKKYQALLNDNDFIRFIESNKIKVYFYPHANMEKYVHLFSSTSKNISIVDSENSDIQKLISDCAFMITDYSSVANDFAYMKKPVIYYQFDYKKFRQGHLPSGYFSYSKDGFGPVIEDSNKLLEYVKASYRNNFRMEAEYVKRSESFFVINDAHNSKRVTEALMKLENRVNLLK